MQPRYDYKKREPEIYNLWLESECFNPDTVKKIRQNLPASENIQQTNKSFCMMMPPPNANDPLHVGHAMFVALEDIITRYHRMLGDDTLWLPGADHAGIETQFVFEKKLKKKKQSRFEFDRQTLYQKIWDYVQENSGTAQRQMKRLGSSADWSRFTFSLDEQVVDEVLKTFEQLAADDLLYREEQLVNYCTHCGTAFSNLEVNHVEQKDPFFYIKYGPFVIGTVRPETKFRDTALAVHPDDERYQEYIGQTIEVQGLLGPIQLTVIADEHVDPDFGTGIMKVTPAHDPHDFELGQKYNLPITPIITYAGRMDFSWYLNDPTATNPKYRQRAEKYHGVSVKKMRHLMKEGLEADGLLADYDPEYSHTVSVCYRCKRPIEPLPLPQFFIKVKPLVEPVLEALNTNEIAVHGAGYDKVLRHWLENLYDWNISRQIVWGIRMPVWYDTTKHPSISVSFIDQGTTIQGTVEELLKQYSLEKIEAGIQEVRAPVGTDYQISRTKPGEHFIQETDTFDTWFSSSQWPFATLKAQSATRENDKKIDKSIKNDFNRFYPTQVMETGYDILPFWVMRMLFMGKYATGTLPFNTIYLHGLVRDQKGQKMSKSKGNVLNPIEVVEEYGADALRLALVIRSTAGLDKSVGVQDFKAGRNFANKIWNATRFILSQENSTKEDPATLNNFNQRLNSVIREITQNLDDYKLGLAADTLYNEFWHWFCDECIEVSKNGQLSSATLLRGLTTFLKLLHPFVPFVTEAVWQELYQQQKVDSPLLCVLQWPMLK